MNVDFFERLATERKRLKWRQSDMAAAGGIAQGTYQTYEKSGGRFPGADVLMAWACAGVDVQYLLTGQRNSAALSPSEGALLEQFRKLDDHGRGGGAGRGVRLQQPGRD